MGILDIVSLSFKCAINPAKYGELFFNEGLLTDKDEAYVKTQLSEKNNIIRLAKKDFILLNISIGFVTCWSYIISIVPKECLEFIFTGIIGLILVNIYLSYDEFGWTSDYFVYRKFILCMVPMMILQVILGIFTETPFLLLFCISIGYLALTFIAVIISTYYTLILLIRRTNKNNTIVLSFVTTLKLLDRCYFYSDKNSQYRNHHYYYLTKQIISKHLTCKVNYLHKIKKSLNETSKIKSNLPDLYELVDDKLKNIFLEVDIVDQNAIVFEEYSNFTYLIESDTLTEFIFSLVFSDSLSSLIINIYKLNYYYCLVPDPLFTVRPKSFKNLRNLSTSRKNNETEKDRIIALLNVFSEIIEKSPDAFDNGEILMELLDMMYGILRKYRIKREERCAEKEDDIVQSIPNEDDSIRNPELMDELKELLERKNVSHYGDEKDENPNTLNDIKNFMEKRIIDSIPEEINTTTIKTKDKSFYKPDLVDIQKRSPLIKADELATLCIFKAASLPLTTSSIIYGQPDNDDSD